MRICNRSISSNDYPLIIAEIGINHNGDLGVAKQMVKAARDAGCEIIKHQTHFLSDEMTDEAKLVIPPNANCSIWDVMAKCALTPEEELELKDFTEMLGMIYISTPFSRNAADFLNNIGVHAIKIGSGECTHLPLIKHIAKFKKPVIMSTGMQTINAIRDSVTVLEDAGIDYALLQCTNLYPSPPETVSLRGLAELREAFPKAVIGFSDHSIGPELSLAAVALGANIVERHFTDTRYRKGPDIPCSMDPTELKYLIDRSKDVYLAMKNPKMRTHEEFLVYKFARPSIVADKDLLSGHQISESDIWARRPGTGEIGVEDFYKVVGMYTNKPIKKNEQISWGDLIQNPDQ